MWFLLESRNVAATWEVWLVPEAVKIWVVKHGHPYIVAFIQPSKFFNWTPSFENADDSDRGHLGIFSLILVFTLSKLFKNKHIIMLWYKNVHVQVLNLNDQKCILLCMCILPIIHYNLLRRGQNSSNIPNLAVMFMYCTFQARWNPNQKGEFGPTWLNIVNV